MKQPRSASRAAPARKTAQPRRSAAKPARGGVVVATEVRAGTMHDMQMTPIRNLRG